MPVQGTEVILLGVKCVERKFWEEPEECTAQDVCCEHVYSGEYILLVNSINGAHVFYSVPFRTCMYMKMALLLYLAYLLLLRRKRRDRNDATYVFVQALRVEDLHEYMKNSKAHKKGH